MIVYYENSNGEKLNLMKSPYRTVDADWYDADWEETSDGHEKTVSIDVFGTRSEFVENMEKLYSIIAVDSENGVYGKLYVNGAYLRCNVVRSKKSSWKGYVYSEVDLTFHAPVLEWIKEAKKSFFPQGGKTSTEGLDFDFDFEFDFAENKRGVEQWNIDHVTSSDFRMIIFGPCINPKILINGYPYEVNATLEKQEYIVIDSADQTVVKYMSNGIISNLFNDRGFDYSIFEKIPAGLLTVNWPGDFGFDLILFLKRREAKW